MDTDDFSVLISVYKSENAEYFRRALESVSFDQTRKPGQIVLVVDGPVGDEISDVIGEFEARLKDFCEFDVIRKEKNGGLAAALNTGLAVCKYDFVARMDSDDVSLPERFKLQTDYLKNNPQTAVLGGNITEFEQDETKILDERQVPSEHDDIVEKLKTRNAFNHMSVMFKKSVVQSVGGYCENFGKLEDYKLWVDIVVAGYQVHNLPDILAKARVGNGFLDRRSNKQEIKDWDRLQEYLLSVGLVNKSKARKNRLYIRAFIYMPKWIKKILYKTVLRKKAK